MRAFKALLVAGIFVLALLAPNTMDARNTGTQAPRTWLSRRGVAGINPSGITTITVTNYLNTTYSMTFCNRHTDTLILGVNKSITTTPGTLAEGTSGSMDEGVGPVEAGLCVNLGDFIALTAEVMAETTTGPFVLYGTKLQDD